MNVTGTTSSMPSGTNITPLVGESQTESFVAKAARKAWLTGAIVTGALGTVAFTLQAPVVEPVALYWQNVEEHSEQPSVPTQLVEAKSAAQKADPVDTETAIRQLHSQSGLTWDQLARLFGVSRRAVHLWAAGGRMNSRNIEFLGVLKRVANSLPAGTPEERRALLFSQDDGRSLYDVLRNFHTPRDESSTESGYSFDQLIGALHDRK